MFRLPVGQTGGHTDGAPSTESPREEVDHTSVIDIPERPLTEVFLPRIDKNTVFLFIQKTQDEYLTGEYNQFNYQIVKIHFGLDPNVDRTERLTGIHFSEEGLSGEGERLSPVTNIR